MRKWAAFISRITLGGIFTLFGANGLAMVFLGQGFIDVPPPATPEQISYWTSLSAANVLAIVKIVEFSAGLMLLSGVFVPLGAVLLAPIVVNILLYHIYIAPGGELMTAILIIGEITLAWAYRDRYKSLFTIQPGL